MLLPIGPAAMMRTSVAWARGVGPTRGVCGPRVVQRTFALAHLTLRIAVDLVEMRIVTTIRHLIGARLCSGMTIAGESTYGDYRVFVELNYIRLLRSQFPAFRRRSFDDSSRKAGNYLSLNPECHSFAANILIF